MRTPTQARSTAYRISLLVASAMFIAACAGDSTAPTAARPEPQDATKALVGIVDGVYTFTFNPGVDQSLKLGASSLDLPSNSVCALGTTSYGPGEWDKSCAPAVVTMTIAAVVRNAATNHPSIEFSPAMRFSPTRSVQLHLAVSDAATLSNMTVMKYCGPFSSVCVDESLTDSSLHTTVSASAGLVSRRIKHFSGYVVAENSDGTPPAP